MAASPKIYDLKSHPEYATCLGQIVAVWSAVELRLSVIFSFLLRAPTWTAWDAYFTIRNSKARIDMIAALATKLEPALPERQRLLDLLKKIRNAPASRNAYSHKPWLLVNGTPWQLDEPAVPFQNSKKHPVSLKKMNADLALLVELHEELRDFVIHFGRAYPLTVESELTRGHIPWPGKFPQRTQRQIPYSDPGNPNANKAHRRQH